MQFVMCCDLVVAAGNAHFSHAEQRIGFAGTEPGTLILNLLTICPKRTREWILSGRELTAQEAKE